MTTPALSLVMTAAGLNRFTAAQVEDDIDLTIATVGLTDTPFVVAPSLTALPGEFRSVATISGQSVGDNIVHLIMRDDGPVAYSIRGFGLFLADGTLFAVYGQETPIGQKSASSTLLLAVDIAFPTADIDNLTFGDTNFLNPPATTETKGVVKLATLIEADAGDPSRVTTGAIVKAMINAALDAIGEAFDGLAAGTVYGTGLVSGGGRNDTNRTLDVPAANGPDVRAGTALDMAVTPAALADAGAVYVIEQVLSGAGGYRVWSDGLKECWGAIGVPANTTVTVNLPTPHTDGCVPTGSCSIPQDEASIGVLNPSAAGFQVRSRNPQATTFYWHTKGL